MTVANPFTDQGLPGPRLTPAEAVAVAAEAFGVHGEARELGSQQDQNFRLDTPVGRYVLKVSSPAFTASELDLQDRAMAHVAARLGEVVPVAIPGLDGTEIVRAGEHDVRLLTYLEGDVLHAAGYHAPAVLGAAGGLVARVAAALADFDHPAADRVLQWDVARAAEVVDAFAPWTRDGGRRALLERAMQRASAALEPLVAALRRQVIHGDANDQNVLTRRGADGRPEPCGLLDFGDVCRTWLAAECAVLAASLCAQRPDRVVQAAAAIVGGFHAVCPLREEEVAAMPALMAARVALCAAACEQQAVLDPASAYAVEGAVEAWHELDAVAAVPPPLLDAALRGACGLPPAPLPRVPRGGPLSPALDGVRPRVVDLSAQGDLLAPGAWRDPAALAAALTGAGPAPGGPFREAAATGARPVATRHGEGRLVGETGAGLEEPATVHLGVDVFLPAGSAVLAPLSGRVLWRGERELVLALDDATALRLAGLGPAAPGDTVEPGDVLGTVAHPAPGDPLPAHLHVQLGPAAIDGLPARVPASLAPAWLAVCPDPAPLLGLEAGVPAEPPDEVLARRRRAVASPQRLYFPDAPPQFERGWRQWLYDVGGRPYLDMVNNVTILGHAHPDVEAAASRQLRRLNTNSRFLYDAFGRYAERLAALVADPLEVVFCVNSGSEAVDLALRLARETTGRRDLICLAGAYHGWTTATDETAKAPPWVHPIDPPHLDPGRSLAQLREAVQRRPPAALLCESPLGNWGGVLLPDGWLAEAYEIVRAAGGLCIADEVQVGFGRCGSHFWAFEREGVAPDLVTLAKPAGNGHPLGAVIATRATADAFDIHDDLFSSPGGSPVSCEIGLAVLDAFERERLQENARRVGEHVTHRLGPLVEDFGLVSALHGVGLYRGLELTRADGAPAGAEAFAVCERLLALGVIVQPTGPDMNVLKLKPPLCVTEQDVDLLAAALRTTLEQGW